MPGFGSVSRPASAPSGSTSFGAAWWSARASWSRAAKLHRRTTKTGRARVVTLPALVVEELAEQPPGVDGLVLPLLEAADPSRRVPDALLDTCARGGRSRALLYYDHVGSLRAPLPGTR
jgi:hypothetical protein